MKYIVRCRCRAVNYRCYQLLPVLLLAGIASVVQAQDSTSQNGDAARVLALETLWNQAEVDKDISALSDLLSDHFIFVDVDGSLSNKPQFISSVKNRAEHIDTIGNDSMATYVYRDAVVVSGTYHEKGTLNGKAYVHRGRFTDTWVRDHTSWMCVASQSTLIVR